MNSESQQKGFTWKQGLFFLVLLVVLAGLFTPIIVKKSIAGDRTKAIASAKSIAGGLLAFKADFGAYPCEETREELEAEGCRILHKGDSANAYFAQLIVSEYMDTESSFYASGVVGAKEGDNRWKDADSLLERGENSFAYLMAQDGFPLSDTRSFTPLVLAPIKKQGKGEPIFDRGPFENKLVLGRVDGSASAMEIDDNGHGLRENGQSLFQSGEHSLFGKNIPVVKYPLGLR